MYKKVSTTLDFAGREKDTLAFWKQARIFEKSVELRRGAPAYTFYDGPPTANGKPHIGHILTRSIKDIIPRYRTMKATMCCARRAGIPMAFLWSWRWKKNWAWTARSRSRPMG